MAQVLLAMPKIMLKVVTLVLESVKCLVLNFPYNMGDGNRHPGLVQTSTIKHNATCVTRPSWPCSQTLQSKEVVAKLRLGRSTNLLIL